MSAYVWNEPPDDRLERFLAVLAFALVVGVTVLGLGWVVALLVATLTR